MNLSPLFKAKSRSKVNPIRSWGRGGGLERFINISCKAVYTKKNVTKDDKRRGRKSQQRNYTIVNNYFGLVSR